jgi:TolB protein
MLGSSLEREPMFAVARMVVGVDDLTADDEPQPEPGPARRGLRVLLVALLVASIVSVFGLNLNGSRVPVSSDPPIRASSGAARDVARIAVVDAQGALSTMGSDGGSIVVYPAAATSFQFPAWSPDGSRIAAIGNGDGGEGVYVVAAPRNGSSVAAPSAVFQSPDHPPFYVYWAPDSRALAYLTTEPDGIALRYSPAEAGATDTTIRRGAPMYWQWLDPGRMFVHSGGDAAGAFAGEIGIDGMPDASTAVEAGSFRVPALSADGRYVAFATAGQGGPISLVVQGRDGSGRHEVPLTSMAAFTFDPRGDTLAFTAATKPGGAADIPVGPLRAIDPATGAVRTLLDGTIVTFFWAPDGKTIAALRVGTPDDTTVTSADGPRATLARAGSRAVQTAAGVELHIVFVDVASGTIRSERVGRLSDLFTNQVLPFFDQYALSHRFWSADSSSIVLPIIDKQGVSQIEVIPADGSDARPLTAGVIATWSP